MKVFKYILTILLFSLTLASCGQTKKEYFVEPNFKVLAKFISFKGGDKLHSAYFKVIKCLNDSIQLKDTISVWYYNYLQPEKNLDTVLLTLNRYDRQSSIIKDNLHCSDNNGKLGIQKAKIEFIDFIWWEGCDVGTFKYTPWIFKRTILEQNHFLIFPCSEIKIKGQNLKEELILRNINCPPYIELTNWLDGKYQVEMTAYGNGGHIEFELKTIK
jgi:hypothetical protein